MNKTALVNCTCVNEFQDKMYGKGVRVTTPKNKSQKEGSFVVRCTVCLREHTLPSSGLKGNS